MTSKGIIRARLALSNEDLKIKLIPKDDVVSFNCSATSMVIDSFSITQGLQSEKMGDLAQRQIHTISQCIFLYSKTCLI